MSRSPRGEVIWITGLPASGKSTFARALARRLRAEGRPAALLDGDEVRTTLAPGGGYDARSRARFYRALAELAALLAHQGLAVIVAATAHRRAFRAHARALAPRFTEIFVDVPLEVCAERDPKRLYQANPSSLPGVGVRYEPPRAPELTAHGGRDRLALERAIRRLCAPHAQREAAGA